MLVRELWGIRYKIQTLGIIHSVLLEMRGFVSFVFHSTNRRCGAITLTISEDAGFLSLYSRSVF